MAGSPAASLVTAGKPDQNGFMENESTLEHETTLEHALDVAKANHKQAQKLLDQAIAANAAGDVTDQRVEQLRSLLAVATEDLQRVTREQ
ncbi:conserved hypothetical protein [Arthrobacter sp. 9V]|nr:conserved hypothetical protein [Arthrobacter sp. 9V]